MDKINYTWSSMYDDTLKIRGWLNDVGFRPDIVVGLARGGVVPAAVLSNSLNVPALFVNWSSRDRGIKDFAGLQNISEHVYKGKSMLIVDDIVESGKTIETLRSRLGSSRVFYAALWFNIAQVNAQVHYHANVIDRSIDSRPIVFPWEFDIEAHPPTEALGDG